jgi:hypothetical protein
MTQDWSKAQNTNLAALLTADDTEVDSFTQAHFFREATTDASSIDVCFSIV